MSEIPEKQRNLMDDAETDLSIEVVILIILGVFMTLFGLLLFKIGSGSLPYSSDSTYGLFLVIVSLQIIAMGKTPFGDLRRSWLLIIIGIVIAVIGMVACFVPGEISMVVRGLVGIILLIGGISLLLQLFTSEEKAKTWIKIPGILRQLTIACALVYAMTIFMGLITLLMNIVTIFQTAVALIIYGISFFYLSWQIHKVSIHYPSEEHDPDLTTDGSNGIFKLFNEASINLGSAILLELAVLLTLLGILLIPVLFGLIPFSPDGEFGILLFIYAIQIMALGETPIGRYRRSRLIIIIGLIFASLGIFSCIVPGILTGVIKILIGVLSILGGSILLIRRFMPKTKEEDSSVTLPSIIKKLVLTQTSMNIVAIIFGVSALAGGIIPGPIVAAMLILYGIILLILVYLLEKIEKMK